MTGLRRSAPTQAIVDLEDAAPDVLSERLPGSGVPFWAQVRMQFPSLLREDEGIPVSVPTANALWRLARSMAPDRTDLALWRGQRDLAFVVGGNTLHRRNDSARNWLVGSFAEALPDRSLIIQRAALASALGRPAFQPTRSLDSMLARAELRVALRRRVTSATDQRVSELVTEFARLLGLDGDPRLPGIIASAAWTERVRPLIERDFGRFLDRVRPRVLVFEDASYGSYYASLIAIARERGVVVAEPQHGWIGPAHAAYNYGAVMHRLENAVALPDTLLTFGEQWGDGLSYPGALVAIGKPHLEERALRTADPAARQHQVLVISSVAEADATMRFIRALHAALPDDWSVRFRPHPSERAVLAERYPGLFGTTGIVLDDQPDVYDSLAECPIVVGVTSTVLFEAAALDCRVFVRDSATGPFVVGDLLGQPLDDDAVVAAVVRTAAGGGSAGEGHRSVDVERLWRRDAVANFTRWIDESALA